MRGMRTSLLLMLSAVAPTCTGTDTGNPPVIDFGNSECGERYAQHTKGIDLRAGGASVAMDPLYDGLTCLAFQRVDDASVRIDVTNYITGCGAERGWKPRVELTPEGTLDLILQDSDCAVAACGSCVYDLSFTVGAEALTEDREVRLYERGCVGLGLLKLRASLPLASRQSGAACKYTSFGGLLRLGHANTCSLRMPCAALDAEEPVPTCQGGLVKADIGPLQSEQPDERCLEPCTSDTDCDALSRCESGICHLSATGLWVE